MSQASKGVEEEWPAKQLTQAMSWEKQGHSRKNIAKALNAVFGTKRTTNAVIGKLYRVRIKQLGSKA